METFIQAKRRYKKEKKKCQKIVAKDVREIKKQGYTSNGWTSVYGTYFRHWGKDGVNKYLEYHNQWTVTGTVIKMALISSINCLIKCSVMC